ncbi:amino acid ABC transporter permease [Tsukamurella sp. 8F]|uniref:amino acid ABC transporter permease n=1 Tax=unclassified Tsukamurella TaxID=2633480 RepID=UPI0023BA3384|nr:MULTISPECIES: amino acid ABC transporter permease [unclassified Tsukamurella]MDF0531470.1 amino acid ABC transporter permease [Tsukamurella sp. 8J]MDF0587467.1 amino acid ABC transporter permease [Tsukamurella sp. 8F]
MTTTDTSEKKAPRKPKAAETSTVLFDARGPRGRARDRVTAVAFVVVLAAIVVLVVKKLADNGHFAWDMWSPFVHTQAWTTYILPGLMGTLLAAVLSIVFALVIGTVLGLGRLSDHRWVRILAGTVVELFRAIPVLILMIFAYFLFAKYAVFPSAQLALAAVVFGLTMYNGSVIAEILRSGINSLPKGQLEAASALGFRKGGAMRLILLPQAVTAMLPALVSQMVVALKDSALGYQIGYVEVVRAGYQTGFAFRGNYLQSLVVIAVLMILINYTLSWFARWLERRLRERRRH